jgi:hypothetical protein
VSKTRFSVQEKFLGVTTKEFLKRTTSMCNQEDKENTGYENFDNTNFAASPLTIISGKESRLQELYEFPESAPTSCLQLLST